uniref:uncharacterized protein n=1 Tax=Pristiophorus japonicus TaxID=55135 RepID=UPI00398EB0E9
MESLLKSIPGTVVFQDDILVTGCNSEEHLHNLEEMLRRLDRLAVDPSPAGLTSLDLYGCSRIQSAILADLIGCLPRLRKLCLLGTQCNSRVLSAIGGRCGELRELDVSQCKEVTPRGLLHLVYDQSRATFTVLQLRRLLTERVALCPSEVTHQAVTVAFLLLALPRLECVAHTFLAEALTLIHGQHFGSGQQFLQSCGFPSLAEVVRSGPRSWAGAGVDRSTLGLRRLDVALDHNLALLTSTCTQVVEAIIVRDDGLTDLAHLTSWGKLTHLTLECSGLCGRPLGEVMPVLSRLGPQLRLLSLQNFRCQPEASLGEFVIDSLSANKRF